MQYYINKRDDYETIRYVRYTTIKKWISCHNFSRGTLLLFHPFRSEFKEITTQDLRIKYQQIEEDELERTKLQSQIEYYQPYQDLLEGIEDYIKQQQEDDEMEETIDNEDNQDQDDDGLELETTELSDINDFIKESTKESERETGLMDKKTLLERIGMLNVQQRQIYDDIMERLMSGTFVDEQFLTYIRYYYWFV